MTFCFAGVSFLALLVASSISDLHAGKAKGRKQDPERQAVAAKQKKKIDKKARRERDAAYANLSTQIASFFDPKVIETSTPSKEEVYAFRSQLSAFLKPYLKLLRGENSQSQPHLIQAAINLYRETLKLNDHFEKRFYDATGPIDSTTNQRMNLGMSSAPSENLSGDSEVFFRIVKDCKETPMSMRLNALQSKYLQAMVQKLMRDYSSLFFQYSFLKDIKLAHDDQTLFGQIENLLHKSEDRYSPLSSLYEWADDKVRDALNEARQTLGYAQAVFNTPTEANQFDPGFTLTSISFTTKGGTPESNLSYELQGSLNSWANTCSAYKLPEFTAAVEHITGPIATRELIGDAFQTSVFDDFEKRRKAYKLDPKIHAFEEHLKALIRINYKKAQFLRTTTTLAEAVLKQQTESGAIDLRDPATLAKHIAVPGEYQDRPRLNPLNFAVDMKALEDEMKILEKEFEAALTNREKLKPFLEKLFRAESEAHVPLLRNSGPLRPVEGTPTHFNNGLVRFDENGDPIYIFPEKVVVRKEDQTRARVEKKWDELTQDELQGGFTSLYTRYLVMRMHHLVHRPVTIIDELSLEDLIQKALGEQNLQHFEQMDKDEKQRTLIETAFYIFEEGRRILLESEFITKIPFLSEDIKGLKNYNYSIFPLPNNLKQNPLALLYELMKGVLMGEDLTPPSELRKRWGVFYNDAANTVHQVIEDSHGSTLFRMAYKFFVFTKQMEEYVSGLQLIEANRINSEAVSAMRDEILEMRKQIDIQEADLRDITKALGEAVKVSKIALEKVADLEKQLEHKKEQLDNNIKREEELRKSSNTANAEKKRLEAEIEKLRSDLASSQANVAEVKPLQERIRKLETEIEEKEKSLSGYQKIIATFQAEIREKGDEKNRLEKDISKKNGEIASLRSQLDKAQLELAELRVQVASYQKSMEDEVEKLQAQLSYKQRSYEERELLEATVAVLEDKLQELSGQLRDMQETPVIEMGATRKNLLSGVTAHQEIAEQIIDEALAKITYTTTAEQQIAILTELGRRLQLVQLTGNFIPEGGATAATDQELAYKQKLEAEKRRLQEENAALRKQLEEVLRSAPVQ